MRLINANELTEHIYRDRLDSRERIANLVERMPTIKPLRKLTDEIATFKKCVKSDNSDYLAGYLCALSAVEGMIAMMEVEQDDE